MKKAVQLLSGGMDSTTLAYFLKHEGFDELIFVAFDYGQRHKRETIAAQVVAQLLEGQFILLDLPQVGGLLSGSALTDQTIGVPHGHYAEESMRQTVVSGRNAMMLSIAWALATSMKADVVAFGAHAGDHFIYPDCRPEFVDAIAIALRLGTRGHAKPDMQLYAPFLNYTKGDIVRTGLKLGVPFEVTWTCYEGGQMHCGKCGACNERREAFAQAGATDPVRYASEIS